MQTSQLVRKLLENDNLSTPVEVYLYERDEDGFVTKKTRFPVQAVFAYEDLSKLNIEVSQGVEEEL